MSLALSNNTTTDECSQKQNKKFNKQPRTAVTLEPKSLQLFLQQTWATNATYLTLKNILYVIGTARSTADQLQFILTAFSTTQLSFTDASAHKYKLKATTLHCVTSNKNFLTDDD